VLFDWAPGDTRIAPREVRVAGELIHTTTGARAAEGIA
jgi:N-acetylglucosamine-6-phosphate deacetylase